jgi:hypothetical protein
MIGGMNKTDSAIIDELGGTSAIASMLGIKPPSVSEWRVKGIPPSRRQTLSLLFPDKTPSEWRPSNQNRAA